ncbi:uncharacterized protein [Fopius arisanus]|uniref:Odorant receptor n=2 Tax=Fopius arisanus TaxID=64838 RepID=A0A9R1T4A2_9HYME|nr:PREDICTED: uncharacterized protein LOC105266165 isoform X1 [Fopius arisanus]
MHSEWKEDVHYALGFTKLWCQALGIWPWDRNIKFSILRRTFAFATQVASSVLLMERLSVYGHCGLRISLIDALGITSAFLISATKILILSLQKDRLRDILQSLINDWVNIRGASDLQIMKERALWGRSAFIVQIGVAVVAVIDLSVTRYPSFGGPVGNDTTRTIIMGPSCWIPDDMSFGAYLVIYYLMFISLWVCCGVYTGCGALMFSVALHICGQFEILNTSLDDLTDDDNHYQQRRKIKEYSRRHNELLLVGNQLNHMLYLIIFTEILGSCFLVCISGVAIMMQVKNGNVDKDIINYALRMGVAYTGLLLYSYVGEQLFIQAEKSRLTIYQCPWYNFSPGMIKDFKFIMMRNDSFCYLTSGGISIINYEQIKDLTRIMFSYFSVFKVMLE